ncbi:unnamed protein product (macronuclear) [Paramecium tetraurelia]|uniref:Uncharacterized protein n=1 Tax=Paramecium tetraurelia TaxID=5888 RepID=A0EBW3_PARTE|nr:uncharacterized protein GSPATT00025515001 [Paramecium tetraurelia]CAK92780.1 unnamed protein product [Paramecium tetraurelia]|eukprot:XP_001460177.1 hypothetical protein (macronuclear) [Paramecium tetraurelia strain d4-2]
MCKSKAKGQKCYIIQGYELCITRLRFIQVYTIFSSTAQHFAFFTRRYIKLSLIIVTRIVIKQKLP